MEGQTELDQLDGDIEKVERGLVLTLLAVRGVHVSQGIICVVNGWSSYRRPKMAALALAMCCAESAWLVRRCWRAGTIEPTVARMEVATGITGLLVMAGATNPADRTTSMNWMLPYTVGSTVGFSLSSAHVERLGAVGALSGTYLATATTGSDRSAQTTAIANAASYPGFFLVAESIVRMMRRTFRALARARREAAERGQQLSVVRQEAAVEQERARQFRLIHDSALQTLEVVAADLHDDPDRVRAQAQVESARLRRALSGTDGRDEGDLAQGLAGLAEDAEGLGLTCSWSSSATVAPGAATQEALLHAAREALRNALKHSGTKTVVIRCIDEAGGVQLTVRDQGVGFDPDQVTGGFGLRQSVDARIAEVGGTVTIWSRPGRGARVTLWVPA